MQMDLIEFELLPKNVLAWWNAEGIWIKAGWTVGIPLSTAIEYVDSFNSGPAKGFYEHDGKVVLSHGCAKIDLSPEQAKAVMGLIQAAKDHVPV